MRDQDRVDARTEIAVVKLPAEIDMTCAAQVGVELAAAFSPRTRRVIADLTETTFCDSAGVRMLVLAYNQAAENGMKLVLAASGCGVRRVFELTGIDSLVPVYATLAAAVASLKDD